VENQEVISETPTGRRGENETEVSREGGVANGREIEKGWNDREDNRKGRGQQKDERTAGRMRERTRRKGACI
jgi:hypothetical protein